MKPEEAIDEINNYIRMFATQEYSQEALNDAIDALKLQIPESVKTYTNLNETVCPECGYVFGYANEEYDGEEYKYCLNCGQALKWGD
jgi:hypothetical protein